jgi:hypothetical protein
MTLHFCQFCHNAFSALHFWVQEPIILEGQFFKALQGLSAEIELIGVGKEWV